MRKIVCLTILLIVFSCTKKIEIKPNVPEENIENRFDYSKIRLNTKKNIPNLWEMAELSYTYGNDNKFIHTPSLFDKLEWSIKGYNHKHQLLETSYNSSSFTSIWSLAFYTPGEHTIYLQGHKDNKLVLSDSLLIHVQDKKDFLNFDWKDVKENTRRMALINKESKFEKYYVVLAEEIN